MQLSLLNLALTKIFGGQGSSAGYGSSLSLDMTSGNNTLDPRITFSRGSNATLTGSNGLIQYAPNNLLTYSEQFDNAAWTKTNATILSNATSAPNSTTTVDKYIPAVGTLTGSVGESFTAAVGNTYVFSVYVKKDAAGYALIQFDGDIWNGVTSAERPRVWLDLSAGTISNTTRVIASGVSAESNGFYRVWMSANCTTGAATAAKVAITTTSSGTTYVGDGAAGMYVWGAQLNVGALQQYYTTTVKNLLGYTQEFDNAAWSKSVVTVASNTTTAPDGSITADTITGAGTGTNYIYQGASLTLGGVYTYSVYVKNASLGTNKIVIRDFTNAGTAVFDIVGASSPTVTGIATNAIMTNVGNGWYRISAVFTTTSATGNHNIAVVLNNINSTDSFYIWGAQLSDSASLDTYVYNPVAAPSAAAYYGPRFDYDPVTLQPKGLLLEEARTNLFFASEFSSIGTTAVNNAWFETLAELDTTVNAAVSPSGTTTAALLSVNTSTSLRYIAQRTANTTAATYAYSVYAKPNSTDLNMTLRLTGETTITNYVQAEFTLSGAGSATAASAVGTAVSAATPVITAVGNGWYRCSIFVTLTAPTNITGIIYPGTRSAQTTASQTLVWGAQLETGAFATSYIPTASATATRAADSATMIGANFSNWYNASEGTLYGEIADSAVVVSGASRRIANINNGTENYKITIAWAGSTGTGTAYITDASVTQANFVSPSGAYPFPTKVALAYKVNDINAAVNGSAFTTDTSGTIPVVDRMTIGDVVTGGTGPQNLNGHIKRIAYYQRRLSNSELQSITS